MVVRHRLFSPRATRRAVSLSQRKLFGRPQNTNPKLAMAPLVGSDLRSCLSTSTGLFNERVPVDWGTQRARLRVDAAADLVLAELPWRRHERPAIGGGVVAVGPNGGRIEHAGIVNSSTESGVIAFAATRAGEYHVYWLPYRQRLTGAASTVKGVLARSSSGGHPPPQRPTVSPRVAGPKRSALAALGCRAVPARSRR